MRSVRMCFLAVVVPLAACEGSTTQSQDRAALACDAAVNYAENAITEAKGRPLVFTSGDEPFMGPISGGEWWNDEW